MRSKISRNDDKVPNKQRNENALDNSISILLNIHKKYNHIKLRVKENKPNRQRPRAPHNTTQYLSRIYHENRISQDMISKMSNNQLNNENTNVIENFLITGGSLKEFFKNVYCEIDSVKENRNVLMNSYMKNLS